MQSNPLRSLGDALREISQRIDDILESSGPQSRPEQQMDVSGWFDAPAESDVQETRRCAGPRVTPSVTPCA